MSDSRVVIDDRALAQVVAIVALNGGVALAEEGASLAKAEAPVLSGHLRDSIAWSVYLDGQRIAGSLDASPSDVPGQGIAIFVGTEGVPYARFVNDGTSDTPAEPFLSHALLRLASQVPRLLAEGVTPVLSNA